MQIAIKMYRQVDERRDRQTDGKTVRRTDRKADTWEDKRWMDRQIDSGI
jgi:hypothetical protein